MPTYLTRCTKCHTEDEIEKPRHDAFPRCAVCGGELKQVYLPPAVIYAAAGFSATDGRLEKLVGHERYARFAAQKQDAETRARQGRLTEYEKALEGA